MNTTIKEWYTTTYSTDEMGQEINPDATFQDLFEALDNYKDPYDIIGAHDSLIRERCFERLSSLTGNSYDTIHEQWMRSEI